jgi:hypothetical protein
MAHPIAKVSGDLHAILMPRRRTSPGFRSRTVQGAVLAAFLLVWPAAANAQTESVAAAASSPSSRRILVLPAVGSAPETGLQLGVAVLAVFSDASGWRRPTSITTSAVRTTKGQVRISLDAERWTAGNTWRIAFNGAWQRFPLPYFGYGGDTPDSARELYTPRGLEASLTVQRRVSGPLYLTSSARVVSSNIVTTDPLGVLQSGTVPGSRGGRSVETSVGLLADSRENLFAPRTGRLAQLSFARADRSLGSEFTYNRLRADIREYHSVGPHTFAFHALVHGTSRGAPFDQVALVGGGDIMRGYARGRYRDAWMGAVQAEYRSPIVRRVGAVMFAGAGSVDSTFARLADARRLATYGVGVRFQLDAGQRTAARADLARGSAGASGVYIGFNQAF